MERAAHAGERSAMVYMARAYDTGLNLANPEADRSISRALFWYEEIQVQAKPINIVTKSTGSTQVYATSAVLYLPGKLLLEGVSGDL